jgi:hypothetical protein
MNASETFIKVTAIINDRKASKYEKYIRADQIFGAAAPNEDMLALGAAACIETFQGTFAVVETLDDVMDALSKIKVHVE